MTNKEFTDIVGSLRNDDVQTEPHYKELSFDFLKEAFGDIFYGEKRDRVLSGAEQALMQRVYPERRVKLYTNDYGFDAFEEHLEKNISGTERIYLGKKVMRLLRINSKIFKSASGRYFKRVKIK